MTPEQWILIGARLGLGAVLLGIAGLCLIAAVATRDDREAFMLVPAEIAAFAASMVFFSYGLDRAIWTPRQPAAPILEDPDATTID